MTDCEFYLFQISLDADGALGEEGRQSLASHTASCPVCAARARAFTTFREVMPGLAETPPDTLTPSIMQKLAKENKRHAPGWSRAHAPGWSLRRVALPLGAAAVLALFLTLGNYLPDAQRALKEAPFENNEVQYPADVQDPAGDPVRGTGGAYDETFGEGGDPGGAGDMPDIAATNAPPDPKGEPSDNRHHAEESVDDADDNGKTGDDPGSSAAYAGTVTLTSANLPDILAPYPAKDCGDLLEITMTVAELDAIWPALHQAGAALVGFGGIDPPSDTNSAIDEDTQRQFLSDLAGSADSALELVLIVIYQP
ncbi:MAG: hypothetical protein FWE59_00380 [Oscillospiraceae bacterium]|nr:hypothetical protein [Oscillospiraceae bacterium]